MNSNGNPSLLQALLGQNPSERQKAMIFAKGYFISPEAEAAGFRQDPFGSLINWHSHGNRGSAFGWERSHNLARANGGMDSHSNLFPVAWRTNASLGTTSLLDALLNFQPRD